EARLVHLPLPVPEEVVRFWSRNIAALADPRDPILGQVLAEPAANFFAERLLLRSQCEIHTLSLSSDKASETSAASPQEWLRRTGPGSRPPSGCPASDMAPAARGTASGVTERQFIEHHTSHSERVSRSALYCTHHDAHHLDSASEISHRSALPVRPKPRRPRHYAVLLEPRARRGPEVAARPHARGRTHNAHRSGRQYVRAPRRRGAHGDDRIAHRHGASA